MDGLHAEIELVVRFENIRYIYIDIGMDIARYPYRYRYRYKYGYRDRLDKEDIKHN